MGPALNFKLIPLLLVGFTAAAPARAADYSCLGKTLQEMLDVLERQPVVDRAQRVTLPVDPELRERAGRYGIELLGGQRAWSEGVPSRAKDAFVALLPDPRNLERIRRANRDFDPLLRHALTRSAVLQYLPDELIQKTRTVLASPGLANPSEVLKILVELPDRTPAINAFEGELDRLVERLQRGRQSRASFSPAMAEMGKSKPGQPYVNSAGEPVGLNTIRIRASRGPVEDWSEFGHIPFERYVDRLPLRMTLSVGPDDLRNFAHEQRIESIQSLHPKVQERVRALYSASTRAGTGKAAQEVGLFVVELVDGGFEFEEVVSRLSDAIPTEDLWQRYQAMMARAPPGTVKKIRFFHTHPEQPGKVSTTLSYQDVEVGAGLRMLLETSGVSAPVDIYALPLSLEREQIMFGHTSY